MSAERFQSYDVDHIGRSLRKLHEQVTSSTQRIEITRDGCDDCCVLISKKELDSLEQALEILADTEQVRAMSDKVAQLAAQVAQSHYAQV
jgi:PHD/YefM family antitoxin component YafN of YafNO toxin-antitoxin module